VTSVPASQLAEPIAALTFDDGPSEWTQAILEVLGAAGARATFFVIGVAIPGNEEIVRAAAAAGHEIGNHSLSHQRYFMGWDVEDAVADLRSTNNLIETATGDAPVIWRPPWFQHDDAARRAAALCGLAWTVGASVHPPDYEMTSGRKIAKLVVPHVSRGTIVGLHDGCPAGFEGMRSRRATVDATRRILKALDGLRWVTVSELLASASPSTDDK
jgi:peptidoglycan/xylan/chitin deacetylase (PgdA/CDA1 family)